MRLTKLFGTLIIQVAIGAIFLFVLNTIGSYFSFRLPINPVTASITGILGVPGVMALVIIKYYLL